MQVLRDHFNPLISKSEDDYNDEFCGHTRIKIRNSEGPHPTPSTSSSSLSPLPAPKTPKVTQTSQILQAILESNKASQVQTGAILEAIKTQASQPALNWQPIVQGALTGLAQAFGAQVSFPSPTPTSSSAPASISTDPTVLSRLEKIDQVLAQQSKTLENLSQGFNS